MHCGGIGHYRRICAKNPNRINTPHPPPGANSARSPEETDTTAQGQAPAQAADQAPSPYAHAAYYTGAPQTPYSGPTSYSAVARASYSVTANTSGGRYEKFEKLPTTLIHIQGASRPIPFLADTGANFNVISTRDYLDLGLPTNRVDPNSPMQEDPRLANGKGGGMGIKGVTRVTMATGEASVDVDLYVARHVDQPLLSRKATLALGILREPTPQQ